MKKLIKFIVFLGLIFFVIFVIASLSKEKKGEPVSIVSPVSTAETKINSLAPNNRILFVSKRDTGSRRTEIYAMDADGGNITRITESDEHHFIMGIDFSRRYIVTSISRSDTDKPKGLGDEDKRQLALIDLQTKKQVVLTGPESHAEGRSFSPDGQWIVFLMKTPGNESDIYKIKIDGTGLTNLTKTKDAIEGDPDWSPVGDRIIFTSLDAATGRFVLKTMNSSGGEIKTVYDGGKNVAIGPFPSGNYDPAWSADGQWITFERAIENNGANWGNGVWHIFKVKADGTNLVDLSVAGNHTDRAEFLPSFSPDGKSIIFASYYEAKNLVDSHDNIFTMDLMGGSVVKLTAGQYPRWIK